MKWLFLHGAAKDVTRPAMGGIIPFNFLLIEGKSKKLVRWLVLNGALCHDDNDSGLLDVEKMKKSLVCRYTSFGACSSVKEFADARADLLEWAIEIYQTRNAFLIFLKGTLSRQERKDDSPLAPFGGQPEIMEIIGAYYGVVRGREARIIRQLVELLPGINTELEDIEYRKDWGIRDDP